MERQKRISSSNAHFFPFWIFKKIVDIIVTVFRAIEFQCRNERSCVVYCLRNILKNILVIGNTITFSNSSRHRRPFSVVFFVTCLVFYSFFYSYSYISQNVKCDTTVQLIDYNLTNYHLLPTEEKTYTPCARDSRPWNVFGDEKIRRIRTRWEHFMTTIGEYPSDKYKGRGIVTSTRKSVYPRFIAGLLLIRWLNCTLPIEIFIFPNELDESQVHTLQKIDNVSVYTLANKRITRDRTTNRYGIKLNAIIESSFEHVLWLDADNIVTQNPEYLFDLPHYTKSSAIFWPDFWSSASNNPIWKILNLTCRAEDYEQESGQIVINKRLGWKPLNLARHFTEDVDIMKIILGDKDTFRLSWRALNHSFYFIRKYIAIAGFYHRAVNGTDPSEFCGHTMVQHDPFGKILFLHANMIKYHPKIKYTDETKYPNIMNLSNPWRILRRYANSAPYLKAAIIHKFGYSCTLFPTDSSPIFEEDFHRLVSTDITMMYARFLHTYPKNESGHDYASIVD